MIGPKFAMSIINAASQCLPPFDCSKRNSLATFLLYKYEGKGTIPYLIRSCFTTASLELRIRFLFEFLKTCLYVVLPLIFKYALAPTAMTFSCLMII